MHKRIHYKFLIGRIEKPMILAEVMKKEENEEVKICSVDKRNLYAHGGFEKNVRIVVKISA